MIQFGVETKFKKLELERFRDFDLAWKGIGIDEASLIYMVTIVMITTTLLKQQLLPMYQSAKLRWAIRFGG